MERFPAVRILETGANLGFAAGNNAGLRAAHGRHLVLLNNDTRVRPGWLAALVAAAEASERVGAVTSKLLFMDRPGVIQNTGTLLLSDGGGGDRGTGEPDDGRFGEREDVFGFCGAAALLRREALDDVGEFDSDFFMYYEDTDLSWRMRLRRWRIVYEPAAVVEHVHTGTSVEGSPLFNFHANRNRLFMLLKNAPPGLLAGALVGLAIRLAARSLRRLRPRSGGPAGGGGGLSVGSSLVAHLPRLLRRRWAIRRSRLVPDAAIRGWMFPRERWNAR